MERNESERLAIDLGHWLAGLLSFCESDSFSTGAASAVSEAVREARLIQGVLMRASRDSLKLTALLSVPDKAAFRSSQGRRNAARSDAIDAAELLRELLFLGRAQNTAAQGGNYSSREWRKVLSGRLRESQGVRNLIEISERMAEEDLPEALASRIAEGDFPERWASDLIDILPRIAKAMSYLSIIASMLERDEPLKASVLLFSRIEDLLTEMMGLISARLRHFPDDSDALFASLDAAAYTASIELKKVHSNELNGLVGIRPTPIVFARIETAYSLLHDSLQMTLVNFAQLIDREIEPTDVFPNLLTKEQQSLQLRENLWHILQTVQLAETKPDSCDPLELKKELNRFRDRNLYFLFYKDMETVERFIEEVVITEEKKDLVPLLHRFGAYIETLLGQVNNRVVLANHPFEQLQRSPEECGV